MKVFVFTDNRAIYAGLKTSLEESNPETVEFFCSEASKDLFSPEICAGHIAPLSIRNNLQKLIQYDIGFSCHSKQIFPPQLVRKVRCINVHPGFNPYNRGWYPQVFSLINKLPAGVTIHEMDADIDHGPIICQERIEIFDWDTSLTVYERLLAKEIDLVIRWLPLLLTGRYIANPPVEEGNYNSKDDFASMREVDLEKTVSFREAIDFLRAMSHPPYFNVFYRSGHNKVWIRLEVRFDCEDCD